MAKLLHDFEGFVKNDTYRIWDDFDHFVTTDTWTSVLGSDGGTATVSDGVGGVVLLSPSGGLTDDQVVNDEAYIESTCEMFKVATDKPLLFAAKVRPVADTIATLSVYVGLLDTVAANAIVDTTGVPKTSTDQLGFYKKVTTTTWHTIAEANSTEMTGITNGVNTAHVVGNNAWDILVLETVPISSTETDVHFYTADLETDGSYSLSEVGKTASGNQLVCQRITHTSAAEMSICFGVKAGTANNSQYLDVDWVYCAQKR